MIQIRDPFLLLAGLFGATAVAAGALGAHILEPRLPPQQLDWFETAAEMQLVHALALLGVALLRHRSGRRRTGLAGSLFAAGTVLFCGSLYGLAFGSDRAIAAVAPVGGLLLIAAWIVLASSAVTGRGTGKGLQEP
jgi:uncharacterized membrane protein YgdD (TMEM256/DUF423 family)